MGREMCECAFENTCGLHMDIVRLESKLAAADKQIRENDLAWARNHELIAKLAAAKAEISKTESSMACKIVLLEDETKRLREDIEKHVHKAVTEIARRTLAETALMRLRGAFAEISQCETVEYARIVAQAALDGDRICDECSCPVNQCACDALHGGECACKPCDEECECKYHDKET